LWNLLQSIQVQSDNDTQWLFEEKNMYYPLTINNNAIIQLFNYFLDFYCVFWEKRDNFDRIYSEISIIRGQRDRIMQIESNYPFRPVARASDSRSREFFPDVAKLREHRVSWLYIIVTQTTFFYIAIILSLSEKYSLCSSCSRKRTLTHIFSQIG